MRKVRKKSKAFQIFAIILSVLLILITVIAVAELIILNVLPTNLLIPAILILVLICAIGFICVNFMNRKTSGKIFSSLFVLILIGALSVGSFYLYRTSNMLTNITTHSGEVKNTVSLIALQSSSAKDLEDLENGSIGYLRTIDNYGTEEFLKDVSKHLGNDEKTAKLSQSTFDVYALEDDEEANEEKEAVFASDYGDLPFEQTDYVSVQALVQALYDGEVDAIVLNETYRGNVEEMEEYADFGNETKVVYETIYYTDKANEALVVSDVTTEPFNILISGNDTYGDVGELSRSDVNMIVTVNPSTGTILLTSIPRDTYVESACDAADGCLTGAMDKITHLGMYGVNASKMTIENFLGIEINYTFRVNFSSVTDIVDALGGIDVYIEEGMAVDTFYADSSLEGVTEGWNHLEGDRALSFARERYAYEDGDNQRVKNQQKVLQAIVDKATSPDIIVNYASLMDAFSGAFETNMSTKEITSLLQYQLQANPDWTFETYQIDVAGDMMYCAALGQEASVSIPDMRTVQIAREKIEAVMNGESSDSVDTEWLETTYPVYNYWGQYDSTMDYRTDTGSVPGDTYTDSNSTYDYGYEQSVVPEESYSDESYLETTDPSQTYTDPGMSQETIESYGT